MWLTALAAAAGTALAIHAWFFSEGINHTDGVLVVMCSSALVAVAAMFIAGVRRVPSWLRALVLLGMLFDIFGTGIAAWFLETQVLMAFMGVALLGWVLHLAAGPGRAPPRADPMIAEPAE